MEEVWSIFTSWQFTLVGFTVFLIMAFFNGLGGWRGVGYYLWKLGNRQVRRLLKFVEAVKVLFLPLLGFGLGWVPSIPRPDELCESSQLSVALLYSVAGLCSMLVVKFMKETAKAHGLDIELDLSPKEQDRLRK